jgi:hypothetical protein
LEKIQRFWDLGFWDFDKSLNSPSKILKNPPSKIPYRPSMHPPGTPKKAKKNFCRPAAGELAKPVK